MFMDVSTTFKNCPGKKKSVRVASDVEISSISSVAQCPDKLAVQRWSSRIDLAKTNRIDAALN